MVISLRSPRTDNKLILKSGKIEISYPEKTRKSEKNNFKNKS
jgi:hypothetical protein